jgi:hypothetical protein
MISRNCRFLKAISVMVLGVFILASNVYADSATVADLRVKLGSAAQLDKVSSTNVSATGAGEASGNFQIEGNWGMYGQSNVGLILSVGLFSRKHSGTIQTASIDYNAAGLSAGVGIGIKPSDNFHFEGKLEIGIGQGKPNVSLPGYNLPAYDSGQYTSASIILGAYYTVSKPGFQIGLELGSQSFIGNYSFPGSSDTKAEGTSGTANIVLGYRF